MSASRSRAESSLLRPTSDVPWSTWRWRLDTSTASKSTSPMVPTPAAARYSAAGEPSPPAPTSRTRARFSARWPPTPISGRMRCRLYRRYSSGARSLVDRSCNVAGVMSASRDGWHDRELVAGLQRGLESADEADVLVVEVDGHERIGRAVFVAEARGQGGEAAHDVIQRFSYRRAGGWYGVLTTRQRGEY